MLDSLKYFKEETEGNKDDIVDVVHGQLDSETDSDDSGDLEKKLTSRVNYAGNEEVVEPEDN